MLYKLEKLSVLADDGGVPLEYYFQAHIELSEQKI